MRIVKFSPQQRVDNPDLTAMSHLQVSEFRRLARYALLGPSISGTKDSNLLLLRGFPVTASPVPDATVTITVDPGGNQPLSAAFLGVDLASHVDTGALAGGEDSAQRLESNALGAVDFTGLAAGSYVVEMRTVYTDGAANNRVFRRESDGTFFVSRTFTRSVPSLEFRATPTTATDDWVPLALVVWAGGAGTISATDITDLRTFAVEGLATIYQTSSGDQDASNALGDFSRDPDRSVHGVNEVFPAIRAANRQIRDLKGPVWLPGEARFAWDTFSRPLAPKDYSGTGLPFGEQHTKHLGSVETTTYTVGDGANTHGDFNGPLGLEQALTALEGAANPLGRPTRARIVVKADTSTGITFTLSRAFDFSTDGALHLTIEAVSANNADSDQGRAEVEMTAVGSYFPWIKARGLTLRNLRLRAVNARQTVIECSEAFIENCSISHTSATDDLTQATCALKVQRESLNLPVEVRNSSFSGHVRVLDSQGATATVFNRGREALFENCDFSSGSQVSLNDYAETAGVGKRSKAGLRFVSCQFTGDFTPAVGGRGIVDGRAAENVTFERCRFQQSTRDTDILHCEYTAGQSNANWRIRDCLFQLSANRSDAYEAGQNGAEGTGWAVFFKNSNALPVINESDIVIEGCRFQGPGDVAIMDSGAILIDNAAQACIDDNHVFNFGARSGNRTILLSLGASNGRGGCVQHNRIDKFVENPSNGQVIAILCDGSDKAKVLHNIIDGRTAAGGAVAMVPVGSSAIDFRDAAGFEILGNEIEGFLNAGAGIRLESGSGGGTCEDFVVRGNILIDVADVTTRFAIEARSIGAEVVRNGIISDNIIKQSAAGNGIVVLGTEGMVVNNNNLNLAGTGTGCIEFGTTADNNMCSGNRLGGGSIGGGGAGIIYGVQNSTRNDLNG